MEVRGRGARGRREVREAGRQHRHGHKGAKQPTEP